MRKWRLTVKFTILFTAITFLISIGFLIVFNQFTDRMKEEQDRAQQQEYTLLIVHQKEIGKSLDDFPYNEYNEYYIYFHDTMDYRYSDNLNMDKKELYLAFEDMRQTMMNSNDKQQFFEKQINGFSFMGSFVENDIVLTFTDGRYQEAISGQFNANKLMLGFIALLVLGNLFILIWTQRFVLRIKKLQFEVSKLSDDNYQRSIEKIGNDEITDLTQTIEEMRIEIMNNEKSKQEMLQNISHDLKTPVAVIKSYAEAILDGISDSSEASIIMKQTDILNHKVMQLLQLNKLEYLSDDVAVEAVSIQGVIRDLSQNYKFEKSISLELDLDETTFVGEYERFYIAFQNIMDNAYRYAKSTVKVTLKNKKLTFYNDGEPIDQAFIKNKFKPYQKGNKGQFGLGMSIVQKTMDQFKLKLTVKNIMNGVEFLIEPL